MCGIAGFLAAHPAGGRSVLERMTGIIQHRGPDGSGFYNDDLAFLGHRRLSIIDVAGGTQPMSNEAGDKWITYNGEIFNHNAIRKELECAGHSYRTRCDTETVLHAYEEYGEECLSRFRGMFSFAIWDTRSQTLFCARDRLGIKPFYYFWDGRLFAFASEIKALLEHPSISPRVNEALFPEYLAFGYGNGDETLFSGIRKLMPGHCLTVRAGAPGSLRLRQYWDIRPDRNLPQSESDEYWIAECRRRLEETVRMRLMSDVPLGMFLSGGLDSSAIAALLKQMATGPVKTFSVGYQETQFSELPYARRVAESLGTEHREVVVGMDDFFDALPHLVWHEDEPITWPSSVSLYFVSRLAAQEVKVVLTGEGSDELFAGYSRYRTTLTNRAWNRHYSRLPSALRRSLRNRIAASSLLSGSLRRKLQHTFLGRDETPESLYVDNFYSAFSAGDQATLLREPSAASAYANFMRYWLAAADRSPLEQMLYADQKTYLVELLMKQDQMSMATSLESRVPLLDHTFVEFAAAVPERLKVRGRAGKYILKKAVEGLLPLEIIYRKKMGFPTPIRQWLAGPRAAALLSVLTEPDGFLAAYLDSSALHDVLRRHNAGALDATDRIWRLLNLQLWGDIFITGRRHPSVHGIMREAGAGG